MRISMDTLGLIASEGCLQAEQAYSYLCEMCDAHASTGSPLAAFPDCDALSEQASALHTTHARTGEAFSPHGCDLCGSQPDSFLAVWGRLSLPLVDR